MYIRNNTIGVILHDLQWVISVKERKRKCYERVIDFRGFRKMTYLNDLSKVIAGVSADDSNKTLSFSDTSSESTTFICQNINFKRYKYYAKDIGGCSLIGFHPGGGLTGGDIKNALSFSGGAN